VGVGSRISRRVATNQWVSQAAIVIGFWPGAVFHGVPDALPEQYGYLRERRIEVGLARIAQPAFEEDFDVEVLFDEPLVVVAGEENPWTHRTKITLAELVNEPWTWPAAGTTFDSLVVQAFLTSGVEAPRPAVQVDSFSMRLKLAAARRFLAIVPASIMRFSGKQPSVKILPVELPTTQSSIGIITLKNRALSPLARLCRMRPRGRQADPAAVSQRPPQAQIRVLPVARRLYQR
jgi:DNA-binding transcriptional LysR family regulator